MATVEDFIFPSRGITDCLSWTFRRNVLNVGFYDLLLLALSLFFSFRYALLFLFPLFLLLKSPLCYNSDVSQVCGAKGPRPRYPRVWKTKRKIGTISKSLKLVECVRFSLFTFTS